MIRKRTFLRWALVASIHIVAAIVGWKLGWYSAISRMDSTGISFTTIALFAVADAWCGWLAWRVDVYKESRRTPISSPADPDKLFIHTYARDAEHGWFAVGMCEKLGLLGTVCGFVMICAGTFENLNGSNGAELQKLLQNVGHGLLTAFVTTLVGVICSVLLHLQYHLLENAVDRERAP